MSDFIWGLISPCIFVVLLSVIDYELLKKKRPVEGDGQLALQTFWRVLGYSVLVTILFSERHPTYVVGVWLSSIVLWQLACLCDN